MEKQLKKCDNYVFLSNYSDAARNIVKILDVFPTRSHLNHPIAEPMWKHLLQYSEKYSWFVKIDLDTFFRPSKMRLSLLGWNSKDSIAVGRPGRNGKIHLVGAAMAISGRMVKQLETVHLDPVQLAAGVWHGEDTVLNSWVPAAGGTIKNTINADHGCTTFSSTDTKELPTAADVKLLKAGKSYTKSGTSKDNMQLGNICYSQLAAIHPP